MAHPTTSTLCTSRHTAGPDTTTVLRLILMGCGLAAAGPMLILTAVASVAAAPLLGPSADLLDNAGGVGVRHFGAAAWTHAWLSAAIRHTAAEIEDTP